MKFLILVLCVCAASAASFEYKPYKPYQPPQQFQGFRKPAVAPVVAAKTTYNTAKFVGTAPVAAAKTTYNAAKVFATPFVAPVVTNAPVAEAKSVYTAPKAVEVVAQPFYEPVQTVAPVFAKAAYEAPRAVPKSAFNYGKESEAAIVRSSSDVTAEGFNYGYETANGIAAESSGALKAVDGANILVTKGSFQYIAPDGTPVKVEYVADENGFQPRSDLLPVAPPVPELIARSLEYIRAHPQKPENY